MDKAKLRQAIKLAETMTLAEIASKLDLPYAPLRAALKQAGVSAIRKGQRTKQRLEALASDLRAGTPIDKAVAKVAKYGLNAKNAWELAKIYEVDLPRKKPENASMQILAMIISGKSQAAIARELNVSRQRVHQVKEQAIAAGLLKQVTPSAP